MKNLKLFICSTVVLLSFAARAQYTRAQIKTIWDPRVMPSRENIDSTWNAVMFKDSDQGNVSGLTSGYIPVATSATTLGNSILKQSKSGDDGYIDCNDTLDYLHFRSKFNTTPRFSNNSQLILSDDADGTGATMLFDPTPTKNGDTTVYFRANWNHGNGGAYAVCNTINSNSFFKAGTQGAGSHFENNINTGDTYVNTTGAGITYNGESITVDNSHITLFHDTGINFAAPWYIFSNETGNTIAYFDASQKLQSLTTVTYPSLTELSHVKGVTSSLQTQLSSKASIISNTSTLDFSSTTAGTSTDLTITLTGSIVGDAVALGTAASSTLANGVFSAWVSASNTVTVRFTNTNLVTALDPASGVFKVSVLR